MSLQAWSCWAKVCKISKRLKSVTILFSRCDECEANHWGFPRQGTEFLPKNKSMVFRRQRGLQAVRMP